METIASVENMEDVATALSAGVEGAADAVRETGISLERLSESASSALVAAERAVEETQSEVVRLDSLLDSLSAEEESMDDDDGESNGSCAAEIASTQAELDAANENLSICEARREKATDTMRRATALRERFLEASRASMTRMEAFGEDCAARVRHACEALEKYIAEHPGSAAAGFAGWLRWTPPASTPVRPDALAARIGEAKLRDALAYEAGRDPGFRARIEDYGRRWASARSLSEKKDILRQSRINGSGELAERVIAAAFRPLGDVSTQNRTVFDDGRYTKTDIVVRNLRAPVILGRGDRAFAPKGGTIAFEIKAGKASYLRSQGDHLVFQAGGHRAADASATICSADIHDLPEADERELRERLRAAGSPILGMLPRKRDIDRALHEAVVYGIGKERP
ncbi:MAG: hypothetical protein ILM98_08035 [Kiritimatiellae bacterium]|nr:hypothetical protein [Kiritimatiellia bacterium]